MKKKNEIHWIPCFIGSGYNIKEDWLPFKDGDLLPDNVYPMYPWKFMFSKTRINSEEE